MDTNKKNNFMVQGAILGIASILVRLIGLFYRIPLTNILGDKGNAYYGVAFQVYNILLLLSSYSLPLAVSKMVSARMALKQYKNTRKMFICAIFFGLIVGIAAFCILFFGADFFANLMGYPQSAIPLRVLAFGLVILSVLGTLRGYFQGLGNMVPTAFSNIVEQIVNAFVSVIAASILFNMGASVAEGTFAFENVQESYGAAGGTLGTVAGAFCALIFMLILILLQKKRNDALVAKDNTNESEPVKKIIKILVVTIVPVILSTAIYNLTSVIDQGIFGNVMLAKGMDSDLKDSLMGMYTGKYYLIISIPIALASALASSLIPSVVSSRTKGDTKGVIQKVESAIKLTVLVSFPCTVGIGILAKPIINLLFPSSDDPEKVALMLLAGCLTVVFYSISTITNSILQGIDHMRLPVIHSAISLAAHVIVLFALLYLTDLDIFSVIISDMFFAILMCVLNAFSLKKYLTYRQEIKNTFIIPALCSIIMGVIAFVLNYIFDLFIGRSFMVLVTIIIAALVYAVLLLALKAIGEEELKSIPGGRTITRYAKRFKLIR